MPETDTEGLRLCCRFALTPSSRGYCGPVHAPGLLSEFIQGKSEQNAALVKKILMKFESLPAYLSEISKCSENSPGLFDNKIVEAYWIGNELLDKPKKHNCCRTIMALEKRGMPQSRSIELMRHMPDGAIPHHNFHVLYVGVGQVTQKIENTIDNMLQCTVSCAKIKEISENKKLRVCGWQIHYAGKKFLLTEPREYSTAYDPLLIRPARGQMIAIHWGEGVSILTQTQAANLEKYTKKAIEAVNSVRPLLQ